MSWFDQFPVLSEELFVKFAHLSKKFYFFSASRLRRNCQHLLDVSFVHFSVIYKVMKQARNAVHIPVATNTLQVELFLLREEAQN